MSPQVWWDAKPVIWDRHCGFSQGVQLSIRDIDEMEQAVDDQLL